MMTAIPSYDIELIRQAVSQRWPEILSKLSSVPIETFNGRQQPCPKCGGTDRFRFSGDSSGWAICNQCFDSKNGDGFAVLQWLNGCDFPTALHEVASYLGVPPDATKNGKARSKARKIDPAAQLEFDENLTTGMLDDFFVVRWCMEHKQGTKPIAIVAVSGRLAKYRKQYHVLAFPVFGEKLLSANPVGWCLANTSGRDLPKFTPGQKQPEWVKVKLTYGSQPGWIGNVDRLSAAEVVWKVEGLSDLLAMLSLDDLPDNVAVIANANGAKEKPSPWMIDSLAGKTVYVVHDADKPGQEGATWVEQSGGNGQRRPGWGPMIASKAGEVRNVVLPYEVAENRGKDLRDYINMAKTYADLLTLATSSSSSFLVEPPDKDDANVKSAIDNQSILDTESEDDPHRLARVFLNRLFRWEDCKGVSFRLCHWREDWYRWIGDRWLKISESDLSSRVSNSIREEFERLQIEKAESRTDAEESKMRRVTRSLLGNVISAMRGMVSIENSNDATSGWIEYDATQFASFLRPERRIAMKNGILDLERLLENRDNDNNITDVLEPHTPRWFSTVCLPYEFVPEAICPTWETFLTKNLECDRERIDLLQEWAGYLLTPDTSQQKFMVLEGEGSNGKSVYLAAITAMLGVENVSTVGLEVFAQRFALNETIGKLANICADVGELDRVAEGYLKAFTSGDRMMFDRKGKTPVMSQPTARLVMACNNRPRFSDRSQGIWRRMIIIPWQVEIPESEKVLGMSNPEWWVHQGELPGIFWWAVHGLQRLRSRRRFTNPPKCQAAILDYQLEVNPAKTFLQIHFRIEKNPERAADKSHGIPTSRVYEAYRKWCISEGFMPLNSTHFGREVKRQFPNSERKSRYSHFDGREYIYLGIKEPSPDEKQKETDEEGNSATEKSEF